MRPASRFLKFPAAVGETPYPDRGPEDGGADDIVASGYPKWEISSLPRSDGEGDHAQHGGGAPPSSAGADATSPSGYAGQGAMGRVHINPDQYFENVPEIGCSSHLCQNLSGVVKESLMSGKSLVLLSALCLAAVPGPAAAKGPDSNSRGSATNDGSKTGGQSYGDRNRGGPYGFYSYPRHRHVDGSGGGGLDRRPFSSTSAGTSPYCGNCHGSAYYGRDYGAPYFGGGYYDGGVYYRERRDH